jgi:hypothetical protein
VVGVVSLAALSNHRGENLDSLFAALYKPAQLLPCVEPGCVFRSMWAPDSIRSGHQFLFDVGSNSVVMWAALFDSP